MKNINIRTSPGLAMLFTDDGLALLDGTKAILLQENLASVDYKLDDWIIE